MAQQTASQRLASRDALRRGWSEPGARGARQAKPHVAEAGWLSGSAHRWMAGRGAPQAEPVVPVAGRRVVRSVDTWTVLRVSFLFYLCVLLVLLIAGAVLWAAASMFGVIHNVEKFVRKLFDFKSFHFQGWSILLGSTFGGMVLVLVGTGANVLAALLYNLIGDLVGGIEITVEDRSPTAAPAAPMAAEPVTFVPPAAAPTDLAHTAGLALGSSDSGGGRAPEGVATRASDLTVPTPRDSGARSDGDGTRAEPTSRWTSDSVEESQSFVSDRSPSGESPWTDRFPSDDDEPAPPDERFPRRW